MRSPASFSPTVVVPITRSRRRRRLAHVSHELRGALMAAELALATLDREGSQSVTETVAAVRTQLERAAIAVDELDAARGEPPEGGGSGNGTSGGVEPIVRRRVEAWSRVAADGRIVALRSGVGDLDGATPRLLIPALDNLIANALEHGTGAVTVEVSQRHGRLRITVADEGPGIPPTGRLRRPRHGRGLGLDIAGRAIRACGGTLVAEPGKPPWLELPIGAPAA